MRQPARSSSAAANPLWQTPPLSHGIAPSRAVTRCLHVEQRVPDVHLQHLALHLDGADENPDLVLVERLRIGRGQVFQLFASSPRADRWPLGACRPVRFQASCSARWSRSDSQIVDGIGQQQAQPGHVLRRGVRLQPLNLLSQLRARHRFLVCLIHGGVHPEIGIRCMFVGWSGASGSYGWRGRRVEQSFVKRIDKTIEETCPAPASMSRPLPRQSAGHLRNCSLSRCRQTQPGVRDAKNRVPRSSCKASFRRTAAAESARSTGSKAGFRSLTHGIINMAVLRWLSMPADDDFESRLARTAMYACPTALAQSNLGRSHDFPTMCPYCGAELSARTQMIVDRRRARDESGGGRLSDR